MHNDRKRALCKTSTFHYHQRKRLPCWHQQSPLCCQHACALFSSALQPQRLFEWSSCQPGGRRSESHEQTGALMVPSKPCYLYLSSASEREATDALHFFFFTPKLFCRRGSFCTDKTLTSRGLLFCFRYIIIRGTPAFWYNIRVGSLLMQMFLWLSPVRWEDWRPLEESYEFHCRLWRCSIGL